MLHCSALWDRTMRALRENRIDVIGVKIVILHAHMPHKNETAMSAAIVASRSKTRLHLKLVWRYVVVTLWVEPQENLP
jgi:hypothetical protein